MEKIPVSPGYRRELTWRFRAGFVLLVGFLATRVYLSGLLGLQLSWAPLAAIFEPPSREGSGDAVVLVEILNYAYAFSFLMWLRYGFVLSMDFLALRIREERRQRAREPARSPRARAEA